MDLSPNHFLDEIVCSGREVLACEYGETQTSTLGSGMPHKAWKSLFSHPGEVVVVVAGSLE